MSQCKGKLHLVTQLNIQLNRLVYIPALVITISEVKIKRKYIL